MSVELPASPFQIMCASGYIQSITINGLPLHGLGRIEQVWEDVLGTPEVLGRPIHVPLRPGALNIPQIAGPREFSVGMVLYGAHDKDQAGHNTAWRTLARTMWSLRAPLNVSRTVRYTSGDETHVCSAKFIDGLGPSMIVPGSMSRIVLRMLNLDGYWYSPAELPYAVTGTASVPIDVPGDAETVQMKISLSGGTGLQILTNTTNGCMLGYNGSTTSASANLDVTAFTATQAGANTVGNVSHSGDIFWMRLEPGVNTLSLTGGGSATILVRAAYL